MIGVFRVRGALFVFTNENTDWVVIRAVTYNLADIIGVHEEKGTG